MTQKFDPTTTPEQEQIEYKSCSEGRLPNDIWETVSAFSNMEGGTVVFGVAPDGKSIGLTPVELDKLQSDFVSQCRSVYNYEVYPQISIQGDCVLAYIPPAPAALRPIYSEKRGPINGGRVRIGSSNLQMTQEWLNRFVIASRGGAEILPHRANYHTIFDQQAIDVYLDKIKAKRGNVYVGIAEEEILIKLRALISNEQVTVFGLLAFGKDFVPQELIAPTINVAVTQYAGNSKVSEEDASQNSLDDQEFSGNIGKQFQESYKFILSKLPVRSHIDDNGRRVSYTAIPPVAIREALANALAHRDYSVTNSRVQIDIYSDRIEFISPGRSLVPLTQLDSAHSETRNPVLMNYLKDIEITEQRARGIRTIKMSIRKAGLLEPRFEHRSNSFVAVLYTSAVIADDDEAWLRRFSVFKLSDHQRNALVYVRHNLEGINNSEYRSINHMSNVRDDIRAKKDLAKLVVQGLLEANGENKYRRYVLGQLARK